MHSKAGASLVDLSNMTAGAQSAAFEERVGFAVKKQVADLVRSDDFDCPKPQPAAMRVLRMSHDPNVSLAKLGQVISDDAFLAGKVIKLANSAAYAGSKTIETISQAVVRVGMAGARDLVFTAAMQGKVFQLPKYKDVMEQLWRHSVGTARMAELLCKVLGLPREHAFLSGLMHDVGRPVVLHAFVELIRRMKGKLDLPDDLISYYVDAMHVEVGMLITARWEIPDYVRNVIAHHHDWKTCKTDRRIVVVVAAADKLIHFFHDENPGSLELAHEWNELGIDNKRALKLVDRLEELANRPDFYPI